MIEGDRGGLYYIPAGEGEGEGGGGEATTDVSPGDLGEEHVGQDISLESSRGTVEGELMGFEERPGSEDEGQQAVIQGDAFVPSRIPLEQIEGDVTVGGDFEAGDGGGGQERIDLDPDAINSTESLEDAGIDNPRSNITFGVTDTGEEVFIRETLPQTVEAMMANESVLQELGLNVPTHEPVEDGIMTQGIDGQLMQERPDNVEKDALVDTMAGNILAGNYDLNGGNLMVDDEGEIWTIDTDQGGAPPSVVERDAWPSSEIMRMRAGVDVEREEVEERITEMAEDLDLEAALDGVRDESVRENIEEIVQEARSGGFELIESETRTADGGDTLVV